MNHKLTLTMGLLIAIMFTGYSQVVWFGNPNKDYKDSFYRLSREKGETGTVKTTNDSKQLYLLIRR